MIKGLLATAPEIQSAYISKDVEQYGKLTHAKVSYIFSVIHGSISNLQHIKIIPASRLGFRDDERSFIHDVRD
jgi:hypothetical protein